MATYRAFTVSAPGEPLELLTLSLQSAVDGLPACGVVVKIHASGVCHTDIHFWRGSFQIGRKKEDIIRFSDRGITYPKVPGHEIAGSVHALGESGGHGGLELGDRVVVYPWIGCDQCYLCKGGDSHFCSNTRELGFIKDGGYSEFVVVPHYRYVFKIPDNITKYSTAATLPCSGITTFSAIKKILPVVKRVRAWGTEVVIMVVGLGGLGLWALNLLKYCLDADDVQHVKVIGVDVSTEKLDHALQSKLIDKGFKINTTTDEPSSAPLQESKRFLTQCGNRKVHAVLNFVCNSESFDFSVKVLHKGGVLVLTGLYGGVGELVLPMTALNEHTVAGNYVGSLSTLDELLQLISKHSIPTPPVTLYKLEDASKALSDLEKGMVVGRIILTPTGQDDV